MGQELELAEAPEGDNAGDLTDHELFVSSSPFAVFSRQLQNGHGQMNSKIIIGLST